MTLNPQGVVSRRDALLHMAESVLATADQGRLIRTEETQEVDFKEEAGRRDGPNLEPGQRQNTAAATQLADEVACMSNTPGGGALLLGVEDKTGVLLGTELDADWLRRRIHEQIGVAPAIEERRVDGVRILLVLVASAREPVADTGDRLRWRVGDSCAPVDRSEWWQHWQRANHTDPMSLASRHTLEQVRPRALQLARRHVGLVEEITDEEFLRRLGALRVDGRLSEAAALLFASSPRGLLELTLLDAHGGNVTNRVTPESPLSLLEQLDTIEMALSVANTHVTVTQGLAHASVRRVPPAAVREAILNGLVHRDWNRTEPTELQWIDFDSTLEVRSPGGFPEGITAESVLSQRHARYPSLADLFRALGLVEKQGLGVDRMYQAMIAVGHRPPHIVEAAGPVVTCTLTGGEPVIPIMRLLSGLSPRPRQQDPRIAILLDHLIRKPWLTSSDASALLQTDNHGADVALQAAAQTTFNGQPLLEKHGVCWLLGSTALTQLQESASITPLVPYRTTDPDILSTLSLDWCTQFGTVKTSDVVSVTGVSRPTAQKALDALVDEGRLILQGAGRTRHYRLPPSA